eukprot:TRINITY_DN13955_c0_g1_i1.p1 TRINITY_DN13955_c0_g1~~TRINITY_DN13955_c0_g1_i1.p1  ORF type:complete len:239 (-),score=55.72 TRINITY_DN13955_c0_g1_i1:92-808(-)
MARTVLFVVVVALFGVLALTLAPTCVEAGDPASSWLAYTVAKGNGKLLTYINATWIVPSYPKSKVSGSEPGWWFGIEPEPALNLIQPILAWGYDEYPNQFSIFNGYYQWDNSYWWSSKQGAVSPGNTIFASVEYVKESNSYSMYIECKETGFSTTNVIKVEGSKIYTDAYFVVEHQPSNCDQYPENGEIIFSDINIELEGTPVTPQWQAFKFRPACNSTAEVLSPSAVKFTWNTSGSL